MTPCETTKATYRSERAARRALHSVRHPHGNLNVYRCGDHWHLGHPDPLVTKKRKGAVG